MKKVFVFLISFGIIFGALFSCSLQAYAYEKDFASDINVKCSILTDGTGNVVLYENNADEKRPVASIVKLMTIYITLQEIEKGNINYDEMLTVSETASGMGGSQVFLDTGSQHTVESLLKSVIIASANDSSVVLAERIAGSVPSFVNRMNETAKEIGMTNTNYVNVNGLPAPEQYSSARDTALLMAHVAKYDKFREFSKIWMEDFVHPTGRTTQMANTNKLIRSYPAVDCGKTGSTVEAGYCFTTRATQGNLSLIAVVLKAENSKERFAYTRQLLDFGFANFDATPVVTDGDLANHKINVAYTNVNLPIELDENYTQVCAKGEKVESELKFNLPEMVRSARKGDKLGNVEIWQNGELVKTIDVKAKETVKGASYVDNLKNLFAKF